MGKETKIIVDSVNKINDKVDKAIIEFKQAGQPNEKKETKMTLKQEIAKVVEKGEKKFSLVVKDGLMGTNIYNTNTTNMQMDKINVYAILKGFFGAQIVETNSVKNILGQGRTILSVNGQPVSECSAGQEVNSDYGNATFNIDKYSGKTGQSVEFTSFLNGLANSFIENLIINTDNLMANFSLNGDDQANGIYGLLGSQHSRALPSTPTTAAELGDFTTDDIISLKFNNRGMNLLTGTFMMPVSSLEKAMKLKDGGGDYIFMQNTMADFGIAGTILNRPVVAVPDDVWFAIGQTPETENAPLMAYVSPAAFDYYEATINQYKTYVNDIAEQGNMIITSIDIGEGCVDLNSITLRGFGVVDNQAGGILRATTVTP